MALLDIFSEEGVIHSARISTGTVDGIVTDGASLIFNRGSLAGVNELSASEFVLYTLPAASGIPVKYWTGSAWVTKPIKMWNGSSWVSNKVSVRVNDVWEVLS